MNEPGLGGGELVIALRAAKALSSVRAGPPRTRLRAAHAEGGGSVNKKRNRNAPVVFSSSGQVIPGPNAAGLEVTRESKRCVCDRVRRTDFGGRSAAPANLPPRVA